MSEKYSKHVVTDDAMVYLNMDKRRDSQKRLPVLYRKKEECCGCTACCAACPVQAIEMRPDQEGFLYPAVMADRCINCYKCEKVCAFKAGQIEKGYIVKEETE